MVTKLLHITFTVTLAHGAHLVRTNWSGLFIALFLLNSPNCNLAVEVLGLLLGLLLGLVPWLCSYSGID